MYKIIKRLFDLIVCLIGLPIFCLIYIPVAIAIKLDDHGPVFYHDHRLGKNSTELIMYKFRTMKVNSPMLVNKDGSTYNSKDDPRVTKVGRFLRETSLDETPQLLNVLKGEMSLIGPRASTYDSKGTFLSDEIDKMKVLPGITGYTQAYYRNSINAHEKRVLDAWYANHASLWLDIKILFKTVGTVLRHDNIYTNAGRPEDNDEVKKI